MSKQPLVGIRREDKSRWERRVPLTPEHVSHLVHQQKIPVKIQPSPIRCFKEAAYLAAGAQVDEDLTGCSVVLAVKEVPKELLLDNTAYVYFSHVIKGQEYNMAMLQTLLNKGCHLFDYEKITDNSGKRLIFFGRYAGLAGMIDTLWSLGHRLAEQGIETPLVKVKRAHEYESVAAAKEHIAEIGQRLKQEGIPQELQPLVVGFAGYGNVSLGAQEIFDQLPHKEISPERLLHGPLDAEESKTTLFKVVFKEHHLVRPIAEDQPFALQQYYEHPELYQSDFSRFLPHLGVLMNCIYWDTPYPKLVTRSDVDDLYANGCQPSLRVIGDITCDIDGSIEVTYKATAVDAPSFVYNPETHDYTDGVSGHGLCVMAVDILPCELPADASRSFGDALIDFVPALASADYQSSFADLAVPDPLRRSLIVYQGQLTPDFAYLDSHLKG